MKTLLDKVETVLLDMDGTLLDKHFDDYFWEQYVPARYAAKNNLTEKVSKKQLLMLYKKREGTLDWTDLDYWSESLGLDIPDLKAKVDHLIAVHPYVVDFLEFLSNKQKKTALVTNAHSKTLALKMRKTSLGKWFDYIVCSQEVGVSKEDPSFWKTLHSFIPYDRRTTLLADDTEAVLESARLYGMEYLVYVAKPSSREPVRLSASFPSITYFNELM